MAADVALFEHLPALARRVPWARLGQWPTPVQALSGVTPELWVKRDDLSGERYGGNKVRPLEVLFGEAQAADARRMWAVGAVGSNHALATALYARDHGLEPGAILFSQPPTACARENLVATLGQRPALRPLVSWVTVPLAILEERRRRGSYVMAPGGATPVGALGYVSAALEVAGQIARGELPAPRRVVVGVGSTCTSAGLLAGTALAARLALIPRAQIPRIVAVRVSPWPVTSAWRVARLAARTTRLLAVLTGDARLAVPQRELAARLTVVGGYIGRGYGHVTQSGMAAIAAFAAAGGPPLDTVYSGKAAAGLLALAGTLDGPTLFWATKSSRPLPPAAPETPPADLPHRLARWLARPLLDPPGAYFPAC